MRRGGGAIGDAGPGMKAGNNTVVNQKNRGTYPSVPVAAVLVWNTTTQ